MQGAPDTQIQKQKHLPKSLCVQASIYGLCGHCFMSVCLTKCSSQRQEGYKNYTETK